MPEDYSSFLLKDFFCAAEFMIVFGHFDFTETGQLSDQVLREHLSLKHIKRNAYLVDVLKILICGLMVQNFTALTWSHCS